MQVITIEDFTSLQVLASDGIAIEVGDIFVEQVAPDDFTYYEVVDIDFDWDEDDWSILMEHGSDNQRTPFLFLTELVGLVKDGHWQLSQSSRMRSRGGITAWRDLR